MHAIRHIVDDTSVWVHLPWTDRETNGILQNECHQRLKKTGADLVKHMKNIYFEFGWQAQIRALTALKVLNARHMPRDCITRCMWCLH